MKNLRVILSLSRSRAFSRRAAGLQSSRRLRSNCAMRHPDLDSFLRRAAGVLRPGPVALVFVEDRVEVESTLQHHLDLGFACVIVFGRDLGELPEGVIGVTLDVHAEGAVPAAVNRVIDRAAGSWLFWCYNAEYLVYPFAATRKVRELLAFNAEERREAMQTLVLDLYADDPDRAELGVARDDAWFDGTGYYARERVLEGADGEDLTVTDIFGGLRWRFEEHVPFESRQLARTGIFRARKGLKLCADNRLNDPVLNTASCRWHRNLTAVIASFRAAKALRVNPGPRTAIGRFRAPQSVRFDWTVAQLMNLGFMEPGQWF